MSIYQISKKKYMKDKTITKNPIQQVVLDPQILDQQLALMGEELYNAYYVRIYKYFQYRLRSKFDAEDLAQTVFLKVITSLQRKMWDGTGALCYIFVVARNTLIDYFRRKKHACIVSDELVDMVADTVGTETLAYSQGQHEVIMSSIKELRQEEAEAVTLRFMVDMEYSLIAKMMGRREDSVRQLVHRGLKNLRGTLQFEM